MKRSALMKMGALLGVLALTLVSVSMAAAASDGRGGPGDGGRGGRNGGLGPGDGPLAPYIAEALGISEEEYQVALDDGTLRDLLEAQGIDSPEEMRALMEEAYAAAVADGAISEELQERVAGIQENREERRAFFNDELAPYYADALGFSYEEYQAAVEAGTAREFIEALDLAPEDIHAATATVAEAALADGVITQEQYDAIIERLDRIEAEMALRETVKPYVAEALGTTVDALDTARENHTLRDLYEELGLEAGDVKDALEQAYSAALEDGVITQEQYDTLTSIGKGRHGGPGRGAGSVIDDGEAVPAGFLFGA